jgi:formate dehydrogenase subunit beta
MGKGYRIEVKDGDPQEALCGFLRILLERDEIAAVMTPLRLPVGTAVMPTLVADAINLDRAEPLSPAFPLNAARLLSRLSRAEAGGKVAVVVRPCELRAFTELTKLHQGAREDLLVVGLDCPGAVENRVFSKAAEEDEGGDLSLRFTREALKGEERPAGLDLAPACRVCEHVTADAADVLIGLHGLDVDKEIWITSGTESGEEVLSEMGLSGASEPESRPARIQALVDERTARRDEMFEKTHQATSTVEGLTAYLASCVNCYNCRVACPVCYCRECVFTTDVFDHEPRQYLNWARRKGAVKMPTDTVFYHLTRMAHMALACVGCGQCSNACPNDIPVMELFRTMAHRAQESFDYEAGRNPEEAPPLAVFQENELTEVVGL